MALVPVTLDPNLTLILSEYSTLPSTGSFYLSTCSSLSSVTKNIKEDQAQIFFIYHPVSPLPFIAKHFESGLDILVCQKCCLVKWQNLHHLDTCYIEIPTLELLNDNLNINRI